MSGKRLRISDPVVVSLSEAGETRWGYHQFPALSRLPDGNILLVYADADDASETHGQPAPAFVSTDGKEWFLHSADPRPIRPHYSISRLPEGEFLACPAHAYFDVILGRPAEIPDQGSSDKVPSEINIAPLLPEPAAIANVYGKLFTYRSSELRPPRRSCGCLLRR